MNKRIQEIVETRMENKQVMIIDKTLYAVIGGRIEAMSVLEYNEYVRQEIKNEQLRNARFTFVCEKTGDLISIGFKHENTAMNLIKAHTKSVDRMIELVKQFSKQREALYK